MLGMRFQSAQIAIFAASSLLIPQPFIHAQEAATAILEVHTELLCPPNSNSPREEPSGPEISIDAVNFLGVSQMPVSNQERIAASVKDRMRGISRDIVADAALERVRAGWQDQGYFKAQVSGDVATLTSSPAGQHIAINVHVDEGLQYSLGGITFNHNKAISDTTVLRGLFPIEDGDTLSRAKIARGLENLRKVYGEQGYINFTSVPDTTFDDDKKLIFLDIDIDEGKQFYLTHMDILGLDETFRQEILKDAPIGQMYNQRLLEQFLRKHASTFTVQPDNPAHITRRLDERAGTVAITLDVRPCPGY
jgi:outer membrane protein assembly factor BamA